MHFSLDADDPAKIWVDRDGQGLVDHFAPCEPCSAIIGVHIGPEEWAPLRLCQPCRADLALQSWVSETCGVERPHRYSPLPSTITGEDEDRQTVENLLW